MSVVRSKRGESEMEFLHTARELEMYSIRKCTNFPKRFTFYLNQPIANISTRIYENVKKANSIFPTNQHEVQMRRDYLLKANAELFNLVSQIEVAHEMFGLEPNVMSFWSELIEKEIRLIKAVVRKEFTDERLIQIIEHFIDAFGDVGLGLGSQISQTFALTAANRLDHYIKEVLHIKHYARYMDDGYLIHPSKEYLKKCLASIEQICDMLHLKLNKKKTQIVKLTHGFTFLKVKFRITESGKIIKKVYHRSVTKMRQKLKSFYRLYCDKVMTISDVYASVQSWFAYTKNFNAYRTRRSVGALYDRLFVFNIQKEELI